MENLKSLKDKLDLVFENTSSVEKLTKLGLIGEFTQIRDQLEVLIENKILPTDEKDKKAFVDFSNALGVVSLKSKEMQLCILQLEGAIINTYYNQIINEGHIGEGEKGRNRKTVLNRRRHMLAEIAKVMPDYLNRAYELIVVENKLNDEGELDATFKFIGLNGKERYVNLTKLFEAADKQTAKTVAVNNLPFFKREVDDNYRELVASNVDEFVLYIPEIRKRVEEINTTIQTKKDNRKVMAGVRAYRRANRPVDNEGNPTTPSYLDMIDDRGCKVSFEDFQDSPSGKIGFITPDFRTIKFETAKEYNEFVKSSEFKNLVLFYENAVEDKEDSVDIEKEDIATFEVGAYKNQNGEKRFGKVEDEELTQNGFSSVSTFKFPVEIVVLPKATARKDYKTARKSARNNETLILERERSGASKKLLKVISLVLAGSMLFNFAGPSIATAVRDIKGALASNDRRPNQNDSPEDTTQVPEDTTQPDVPDQTEPDLNNTTIAPSESEMVENPAEENDKPIDNLFGTGEDATIYPEGEEPDESTTGAGNGTTAPSTSTQTPSTTPSVPDSTTTPEETNDPDKVPGENTDEPVDDPGFELW